MNNIFNPVYRQDFLKGYARGFNPNIALDNNLTEGFTIGFNQGREDYESLNGKIIHGIPKLIVTYKLLEDFLLAGMLGMSINDEDYTAYQIDVIQKWYQSGVEKYDASHSEYLLNILEENGIELM
jgi:hypothetical protein